MLRRQAEMGLSLLYALGTYSLSFALRALAKAYMSTAENPREVLFPIQRLPGITSDGVPLVTALMIVLFVIAWWFVRSTGHLPALGFGLLVGGAAANITEHIVFGRVTDYIPIHWPKQFLLNFADLAIIAGLLLIAISLLPRLKGPGRQRYRRLPPRI